MAEQTDISNSPEILKRLFKDGKINTDELLKLNCIWEYADQNITAFIVLCRKKMDTIQRLSKNSPHKILLLLRKCICAKTCIEEVLELLHEDDDWQDETLHYAIEQAILAASDCIIILNAVSIQMVVLVYLFKRNW